MKKDILKSIKILTLALVIGVGTSLVFGEWVEPTGTLLSGFNATAPVNESSSVQTKAGSLNLINDADDGKIFADILAIFGTSYFAGNVDVGNSGAPFFTPDRDLFVTGKVGINLDAVANPTPSPTATIDVNGQSRFSNLRQLDNPDADYPAPVCITLSGTLILCPQPGDLLGMINGPHVSNQDVLVDIFEHNADDHDCYADVSFDGSSVGGYAPIDYSWRVKNNSDAPYMQINGVDVTGGLWKDVGSSATTNFSVAVKNPYMGNRDDWTIELTSEGNDGEITKTYKDFDVWTIDECKD